MQSLVVFGGSFDPVHSGHLAVIESAMKRDPSAKVVLMPTGQSPLKNTMVFSRAQRLIALIRATHGLKGLTISDYELLRSGPNYTIDTFEYLRDRYQPRQMILLIGTDQLMQIEKWKDYTRLIENVSVWIAPRNGVSEAKIRAKWATLSQQQEHCHILEMNEINESATTIRQDSKQRKALKTSLPRVIGITGRAGSGKSTATESLLGLLNAQLIDLDKLGHALLDVQYIKQKIADHYGAELIQDGRVDRRALGRIVFNDSAQREWLDNLMHPIMKQDVYDSVATSTATYIVIDGALIRKIGLRSLCDPLICIDATDEAILEHAGEEKLAIANVQAPRSEFAQDSDILIPNSGNQSDLNVILENLVKKDMVY
ncbi:MAG: nicotinate (nicotinamide) nucleotide adenylyltransferase [bacterium]|nr:nicotinate (nicotinamide) nucleotide adenylyltransferase [bacterium]